MATDTPTERKWFDPILLAPLIFVCHFLEEAPTFVPWFNAHVSPGITPGMFWRVNLTGLVITLIVAAVEWYSRSGPSLAVVIAWLGSLMFANALFHIIGTLVDGGYVPGVITAALLYLPFYSWLFVRGVKQRRLGVSSMIVAAIIGAIPMALHGYLILFRGSRLF
jgi:uncharacterized protein with HXXEE motif